MQNHFELISGFELNFLWKNATYILCDWHRCRKVRENRKSKIENTCFLSAIVLRFDSTSVIHSISPVLF